jgi:glutaredoxin-like protein NrdH
VRQLPVRLFTKPGCSACVGVKQTLEAKGVQFDLVDISKDYEGGMTIVNQGFRTVPVLELADTTFVAGDQLRELVDSL